MEPKTKEQWEQAARQYAETEAAKLATVLRLPAGPANELLVAVLENSVMAGMTMVERDRRDSQDTAACYQLTPQALRVKEAANHDEANPV